MKVWYATSLQKTPGFLVKPEFPHFQILLGWVGDWKNVSPSIIYAFCMVLCGAVTFIMPLLKTYLGLAAASGAFGAFIAANYSLTSIILVEQITLEKFTNAYGLLLLMQGMANLIGPPLAGKWNFLLHDQYHGPKVIDQMRLKPSTLAR